MFENVFLNLADVAFDPFDVIVDSGLLPIIAAVAVVVIGAIVFLKKKKR